MTNVELIDRLEAEDRLAANEWVQLIDSYSTSDREYAAVRAREISHRYFDNKVYTRGLIEFTSCCRNDCYYCGIRRSNQSAERYRLTEEQILQCCEEGYRLGFRTFVLQGGDPEGTGLGGCERMDITRMIGLFPSCLRFIRDIPTVQSPFP